MVYFYMSERKHALQRTQVVALRGSSRDSESTEGRFPEGNQGRRGAGPGVTPSYSNSGRAELRVDLTATRGTRGVRSMAISAKKEVSMANVEMEIEATMWSGKEAAWNALQQLCY